MGTSEIEPLPTTTVDLDRLAAATTTPTASTDEAGRGSAYDPAILAAGRLVHVHPVRDSAYLVAFDGVWKSATLSTVTPGTVTAKTDEPHAMFYWLGPDSKTTPVCDRNGPPGLMYGRADTRLLGGASHGVMAYYLATVDGAPVLLAYRVGKGVVSFVSSRWVLPSVPYDEADAPQPWVSWNKGIAVNGGNLYLIGEQPDHTLYLCKHQLYGSMGIFYLGERGWYDRPSALRPLSTSDLLAPMTAPGRVTLAYAAETWLLGVGLASSTLFFRARHPRERWVALEIAPAATPMYFQPGVVMSAAYDGGLDADQIARVPYSYTVETPTALRTSWAALAVPRQRL